MTRAWRAVAARQVQALTEEATRERSAGSRAVDEVAQLREQLSRQGAELEEQRRGAQRLLKESASREEIRGARSRRRTRNCGARVTRTCATATTGCGRGAL
jgi:hypothetical protein